MHPAPKGAASEPILIRNSWCFTYWFRYYGNSLAYKEVGRFYQPFVLVQDRVHFQNKRRWKYWATLSSCPDACMQRHAHWRTVVIREFLFSHQKEQMTSLRISLSSIKISDMFTSNMSLFRVLTVCSCQMCSFVQVRLFLNCAKKIRKKVRFILASNYACPNPPDKDPSAHWQ